MRRVGKIGDSLETYESLVRNWNYNYKLSNTFIEIKISGIGNRVE